MHRPRDTSFLFVMPLGVCLGLVLGLLRVDSVPQYRARDRSKAVMDDSRRPDQSLGAADSRGRRRLSIRSDGRGSPRGGDLAGHSPRVAGETFEICYMSSSLPNWPFAFDVKSFASVEDVFRCDDWRGDAFLVSKSPGWVPRRLPVTREDDGGNLRWPRRERGSSVKVVARKGGEAAPEITRGYLLDDARRPLGSVVLQSLTLNLPFSGWIVFPQHLPCRLTVPKSSKSVLVILRKASALFGTVEPVSPGGTRVNAIRLPHVPEDPICAPA